MKITYSIATQLVTIDITPTEVNELKEATIRLIKEEIFNKLTEREE